MGVVGGGVGGKGEGGREGDGGREVKTGCALSRVGWRCLVNYIYWTISHREKSDFSRMRQVW